MCVFVLHEQDVTVACFKQEHHHQLDHMTSVQYIVYAVSQLQIEGVDLPLLDGTLDSLEEGEESQTDSQDEGTSTLMEVDSISTQVGRTGCAGVWGM